MVGDVVHVSLSASLGRTMMDEKFDSESGSFSHHSGTLCLHSSLEPHCHCSCLASISVCFLYIHIHVRSKTQRHRPVDETLQKVRWSGAISRVRVAISNSSPCNAMPISRAGTRHRPALDA